MKDPTSSESVENYLKAIYELQEEKGRVTTTALAERLMVASPSVTAMVKKLSASDPPLLDYESHKGVALTETGREKALEIIRHHRLLETFLCTVLGYSWDEVHEEAERLEHYISEQLEDRIAEYLDHPCYDPHGAPIPTKSGSIAEVRYTPLSELEIGKPAKVLRVRHDQQEMLRYLTTLGIRPDVIVTIVEKAPFDGLVHVRVESSSESRVHAIGPNVADRVLVEIL